MKIPVALATLMIGLPLAAQSRVSPADQLLDRIVEREATLIAIFQMHTPVVETYIQETPAAGGDAAPTKDHYFLGQIKMSSSMEYVPLIERTDPAAKGNNWLTLHANPRNQPMKFLAGGFAQMAFPDLHNFNRQTYSFEFVRREFLGEVRCLVFDVAPRHNADVGRFIGRIWVEDQGNSIVRFNGTYLAATPKHGPAVRYFHFDSWRVNVASDQWVPAQIYVEEEGSTVNGRLSVPRFKAQTRMWAYTAAAARRMDELTTILIEPGREVQDQASANEVSPLESQRLWERQAEENVMARLTKAGLLAQSGPVDQMLDAILNNLIFSANPGVDVRCRVLLTTPLETFSIGRTIVISRGLLDVLPDETSLALVLANELSHIALGHRTPTQFAFRTQTMFSDADLLQRIHFQHTPAELEAAGKKTVEIMQASPYHKTGNARLFLKTLAGHSSTLPRLLVPNIGNQVVHAETLARLSELTATEPEIEDAQRQPIAALPLGSRIKLDPWTDEITLIKTRPLEILSPREVLPFEITPFMLYLTRVP
jgi:hypothetical protein